MRHRTGIRRLSRLTGWTLVAIIAASVFASCGGGSSSRKKPTGPVISNINGSTDPASPVAFAIEVNGSGFRTQPGEVHFTDALDPSNVAVVLPAASAWSDTGIVAVVPAAGTVGTFPIPGTVTVTVATATQTSNGVDLDLVDTPSFSVNNVTWQATTPLVTPLRGLRAVGVKVDDANAYMIVAGGNDGTANVTEVLSNTLGQDGTLGASWNIGTNPLPFPRAHHAMAEANPGNAPLLNLNDRYVYVVGGQQDETSAPGGVDTVYMAFVSIANGNVGMWSQTSRLPEPLIGPAVTIYNGYVYLVGGLRTDGTPADAVLTSHIRSDGTLEGWVSQPDPYPVPVSFARLFAFGGYIYVVGGDAAVSLDPNEQGTAGEKGIYYATAQRGSVGPWNPTAAMVKQRKKHVVWSSFGQIISAEGIYQGGAGSIELEVSAIQPGGTLASWNGMTSGANQINANVYNAAGLLSPIRVLGGAPRFLLLGGQEFVGSPPGLLSDAVYYNDAP